MNNSKKQDPIVSVDPFLGNWEVDTSPRQGLAARWRLPKALVGNTHPGAVLPLGMVSALPYSGGYVTGYGPYEASWSGLPKPLSKGHVARGVTHFHHSGAGMIDHYYNYARVSMVERGTFKEIEQPLVDEQARPGYYAAHFGAVGPRVELTVTRRAALHRYTFHQAPNSSLRVDFASAGLDLPMERLRQHPNKASVQLVSPNRVEGVIHIDGIQLYIAVELRAAVDGAHLFRGSQHVESLLNLDAIEWGDAFGALFDLSDADATCEVRLGFSYRSLERAREGLAEIDKDSFDTVAADAEQEWRDHLGAIEIETDSADDATKFYSALYHTLIKPVSARDESPLWPESGPCMLDLGTLWDQYKALYPLLFTVYPQWGQELVGSLLQAARRFGCLWRAYLPALRSDICSLQASGLGHITLADAFFRMPESANWKTEFSRLYETFFNDEKVEKFRDDGVVHPISHTLDLAQACWGIGRIAQAAGDEGKANELMQLADQWQAAIDAESGLAIDSVFYEGGRWNYSFRLLHDMAGRIKHIGGVTRFIELLDDFFGYGADPVRQLGRGEELTDAEWAEQRFEGLNNEPDMETPYAYIYAGRHDRTCEVIDAVRSQQFRLGRYGLPGNDDSGGLSSWYVWSAMGLFPVAGQPLWLIGTPGFDRVSMVVAGGHFEIVAIGRSADAIYVASARLNGEAIDHAWLTAKQVARGGTLELVMSSQPTSWAQSPPEFDHDE